MKRYICFVLLLFFFLLTTNAARGQKGTKDKLQNESNTLTIQGSRSGSDAATAPQHRFIWIAPLKDEIVLAGDVVEILMQVESNEAIDPNLVVVEINGKEINSKADIVKLSQIGAPNTGKYTIRKSVELAEGLNEIRVGVKGAVNGRAVTAFSGFKRLQKDEDTVKEVMLQPGSSGRGIFWMNPQGQSNAIVHEQYDLDMRLQIHSPVAISKDQIYFVVKGIKIERPSSTSRLRFLGDGQYEFTNTFHFTQPGIQEIVAKIKNEQLGEITSEPIMINFSPFRPNIHLLSVGTQTNLEFTINDARDFAGIFQKQGKDQGGKLFNEVNIETLLGQKATANEIKKLIENFETKYKNQQIGEKDLIILYLSSHGFLDDKRQLRIQGDDYDPAAWRTTSVSYESDIVEILNAIPCKKLIFIDACYSGGSRNDNEELDRSIEVLNSKLKGVTTIVSSRGDEVSFEDPAWQNGAFTEAIIEALARGYADDGNDIVTINELWLYLNKRVPELVKQVKAKGQHPKIVINELGDVAIFSLTALSHKP